MTADKYLRTLTPELVKSVRIVPMTRDRVQLEWHQGRRSLELEFDGSENIVYLKWDPDKGIEEEGTVTIEESYKLLIWWMNNR